MAYLYIKKIYIYIYVLYMICVCVLVAQSCLIFHDSMDYNQSGSSVHGNFQARILEQNNKNMLF